jgi:hypothetical protein
MESADKEITVAPHPVSEEEFKLSTNPFEYLDIVDEDDAELNKDVERAFFNFYESPEIQKTIYDTIAQDIRNPNNPDILILGSENKRQLFTGCNEDLFIKKSRFVIKRVNEIICPHTNNDINGYIDQTKLDWNRVSNSRPIYTTKYNKFFSVKTNESYIKSNNKNYLTVVNALYNFLLNATVEDDFQLVGDLNSPKLQDEDIEFTDAIGKISCGCETLYTEAGMRYSTGCESFTKLKNIPEKTLDILYKLLIIFQSSAVSLVESFNNYLNNVKCKYDRLVQSTRCKPISFMYFDTYYYFDEQNESLVTFFKIFLQIEGDTKEKPEFIPFYKVINVYPIKKYDYSYSFFYIDNDLPYGDGKYNNKLEQIDVFKFMETRIKIHLGLDVDNFDGLFYAGDDLKNYQKTKALIHRERNKANINSLIGGKHRNKRRVNRKRKTTLKKSKAKKSKKTRKNKKARKSKRTRKNNKSKRE